LLLMIACASAGSVPHDHSADPEPTATDWQGLDVEDLAEDGQPFELSRALVAGKITVFDFHATWCAPCRQVDAHMLHVLRDEPRIALRKIEIEEWGDPLVRSLLVGVPELPYLIVYAADGHRVARITGLDLAALDRAIARALTRGGSA
jgi:thiol-disulfide isomerase/thioredoxin